MVHGYAFLGLAMASMLGAVRCQLPQLVPAIMTFGDSSVDVGNNNQLPAMFKANFLPYGKDFTTHSPTGRFCDGKLVIDYTAETLGFQNSPPAYLSKLATGKMLLHGANFASAGSGYYDMTSRTYNAIPLSQQLEYYRKYTCKLTKMIGKKRTASILSEAMHIVSTGNGDYVQNYYINPSISKAYCTDKFSSLLISKLSSFVKGMHGLGARRIGVTSLPPLGCLPSAINKFGNGNLSCIPRLNQDAQAFNEKLKRLTLTLAKELPNLKIAVLDIYAPLLELSTNPSRHGFVEARKGCCATGTLKTTVLCKPGTQNICKNATEYVFWDGVHPSQAANKYIAESVAFDGITLLP